MGRIARKISSSGVYHIIFKGNNEEDIFYDDTDKEVFLNILIKTKEKYKFEIYSYCLMINHVHLVLKVKKEFLSEAMKILALRYSMYFNKKLGRTGHLFKDRFFSRNIENLPYFLMVCKYVHRNPEKAKIEKTEKFKWSSYQEYKKGKSKIINLKVLLSYFENDLNKFDNYTLLNDDVETLKYISEFEIKDNLEDDELKEIITETFNLHFSTDVGKLDKKERKLVLAYLKNIKGITVTQIARVTNISRYYIKKIYE